MENRLSLSISLPFVAGTALGAALPVCDWGACAALTAVAGCLVMLACGRRRDRILLVLLLFSLGLFCYSSRAADLAGFPVGAGSEVMVHVRGRIDDIPFGHGTTAPLLRALMTGDRSGLDRQTVTMFRRSGASHLLALSGLHLGIIALFLRCLLTALGNSRPARIVRATVLVGFCLAYTVGCGASPSLLRALLFIILQQIAALSPGRRSSPADRLCIAATVQLAFDPMAIGSVAFQLSYMAMLGIVFIAPRLEAWYPSTRLSARIDPVRWIWKAASLALSCQLTTAPLVWLRFGSLPRYFLLTNLLAMPLCELLLPLGIVTLALTSPFPHSELDPDSVLIRATDALSTLFLQVLRIIADL